jgi:hypothetical protein
MENTVNQHAFRTPLKIDTIITCTVAVEPFSLPLDDAEHFWIQICEIVRQELKLRQQFELKFHRNPGYFSCADLVEDDLIHRTSLLFRVTQSTLPSQTT